MKGIECPNHHVELILTDDPGIGICPISREHFRYKADNEKSKGRVKIIGGKMVYVKDYDIKPLDGGEE